MKYHIMTYGCQMNVHESEKISFQLANFGECTNSVENADIIVLNTCCIRESAEDKIIGNLGDIKHLKKNNPDIIVAVCGCLPQREGGLDMIAKKFPFVDIIVGTHNNNVLGDEISKVLMDKHKVRQLVAEPIPSKDLTYAIRTSGINAWVNIMYGCDNYCSYCIVPYVRGRERSRASDRIISEVKELVANNYKIITLLGQNVNSYHDTYTDFSDLLEQICQIEGDFWVRFMTSHPKDITLKLISTIARLDKVCNYIHLPVQSGSTKILSLMNRNYSQEDYLISIDLIRKHIANVGITSDIIVGFPGESEDDFEDTLQLVSKVQFNNLYTFLYSSRSGTVASQMCGHIDIATKRARLSKLIALQKNISSGISQSLIGNVLRCVCSAHKKDCSILISYCGKSITVKQPLEIGSFYNVKLISRKNNFLYGKVDE